MRPTRFETRYVMCDTCPNTWRIACPECAEHFADYHRGAFGHDVIVNGRNTWQFRVPRGVQRMLGRSGW